MCVDVFVYHVYFIMCAGVCAYVCWCLYVCVCVSAHRCSFADTQETSLRASFLLGMLLDRDTGLKLFEAVEQTVPKDQSTGAPGGAGASGGLM